jgi:hypothetical protein
MKSAALNVNYVKRTAVVFGIWEIRDSAWFTETDERPLERQDLAVIGSRFDIEELRLSARSPGFSG